MAFALPNIWRKNYIVNTQTHEYSNLSYFVDECNRLVARYVPVNLTSVVPGYVYIDVTDIPQAIPQIAKFMGPTWGPSGSCRPQMGPMLAPWTLLSGYVHTAWTACNSRSLSNIEGRCYREISWDLLQNCLQNIDVMHDDVMTWKRLTHYWPFCAPNHCHRWIPLTRDQ